MSDHMHAVHGKVWSEKDNAYRLSLECGNPNCSSKGRIEDEESPFLSHKCRGCDTPKQKPELTKDEILARVATAYDMGLLTGRRMKLMERWLDFVLRFEGGQLAYAVDFLEAEKRRNGISNTGAIGRLAGDADGYALNVLAAILTHKCQACATDKNAWHTRAATCPHADAGKTGF